MIRSSVKEAFVNPTTRAEPRQGLNSEDSGDRAAVRWTKQNPPDLEKTRQWREKK